MERQVVKLIKLKENLFQVDFDTQRELTRTMLRFQEFYESPKFRGRAFSLREFKEWYRKENGVFNYYSYWEGFNFPDYIVNDFRFGKFKYLTKREMDLLKILPIGFKYYVIGTFNGGDNDVIEHELCHAEFYINSNYAKEVTDLILSYKKETLPLREFLSKEGYHDGVHIDEINAYLVIDKEFLLEKGVSFPGNLQVELSNLAKKYKVLKILDQ
jgi:hypothetical protein